MSKVVEISPELRRVIREEVAAGLREALAAQAPTTAAQDSAMRMTEIVKVTGLSKSAIYAMIAEGKFPAGFQLGSNSKAWLASDVQAWINERVSASRKGAQA